MSVSIYFNPSCSKCRQTLALLEEHGVEPDVVKYLDTPLDEKTLRMLLKKLGMTVRDLVRSKEANEEGIDVKALDDDELVRALVAHPRALQRPIVVKGDKAVLGRPPENVLELL